MIFPVFGVSSTNKLTFNCNGATIQYTSNNANYRSAVVLNGADNVVIDSLNIDVSAGTYGWGILLTNQADSNIIRKCTITSSSTNITSGNHYGIVISGSTTSISTSGNNANVNQFINNTVTGGYHGIYVYGSTAPYNKKNSFINNKITDFYSYGIYTYGQDSLTVSRTEVTRPTRATVTAAYGIYTSSCTNLLVERNSIHNLFDASTTSTSATYAIYNASSGVSATQPNRYENNLVYNINNGGGAIYGFYALSYTNTNFYHNTIVLDDASATAGTTYGTYAYGTGMNLRNNIIHIARGGTGTKYCLYIPSTSFGVSNNNVLFMGSTTGTTNSIGYYNATGYPTFSAWQAANGATLDQQSLNLDATFNNAGAGDYTPFSSLVNNTAAPLGVTTDILGVTRSTSNPDPGAYEFSTLTAGLNFGAEALLSPAISSTGCYTNAETFKVRIRNNRTITHNFATNPVTVNVSITGAVTQNLTLAINTGTLASDGTMDVTLPTAVNMTTVGTYNIDASTALTGDVNNTNDAMLPVTRIKADLNAGTAAATPSAFCQNGGTPPTLSSTGLTGAGSLQWQQSTTTGSGFTNIATATTSPFAITAQLHKTCITVW